MGARLVFVGWRPGELHISTVKGLQSGQERTPARGYDPLIISERRSRTHPVLLQEIYEGAHLRQKQAGAQG